MIKKVIVTKLERGQYIRLQNRDNKPFLGLVTYVGQHNPEHPQSAAVLFQPRQVHSRKNGTKTSGFLPLSINANGVVEDLYGNGWAVEIVSLADIPKTRRNKLP
jgi:hypothetical protein